MSRLSLMQLVEGITRELERQGSRRPSAAWCEMVQKNSDPALPLADLMLGVFGEYARSSISLGSSLPKGKRAPGEQARLRYTQLQGRVRAVFDEVRGKVYSRRDPFQPWTP